MRVILIKKKLCKNCHKISSCVNAFSCTQNARLCDNIDERLLELVSSDFKEIVEFRVLDNISKQILINCVTLKEKIKTGKFVFPKNSHDFVQIILEINKSIFNNISVEKLGRFRINDEEVEVDGDGVANKHAFLGVKSQNIQSSLSSVWERIFVNIDFNNKEILEILCAKFLVFFFALHPFLDGNGRTARFFLDILLFQGNYQIDFPSQGTRRRQYIKGLRVAHKIRKEEMGKVDRNSCFILIDLMTKIITPKDYDDYKLADEE